MQPGMDEQSEPQLLNKSDDQQNGSDPFFKSFHWRLFLNNRVQENCSPASAEETYPKMKVRRLPGNKEVPDF